MKPFVTSGPGISLLDQAALLALLLGLLKRPPGGVVSEAGNDDLR